LNERARDNQWYREEVFEEIYGKDSDGLPCHFHSNEPHKLFLNWLSRTFSKEYFSVVDVGCGCGRLLNFLPENLKTYIGIDVNPSAIEFAYNHFSENKKATFHLFDIEEDGIGDIIGNKQDVIYFDSTFTMLRKPKECFSRMFEFCNIIYLARTPHKVEKTTCDRYKWEGMIDDSENWNFSFLELNELLPSDWKLESIEEKDLVAYKENKFGDIV